mgnify:CR=1 FL=1|tara:strand:+ start:844 stop:1083 length:240 start_codon:yes stop_codon:yes gene_type:complete
MAYTVTETTAYLNYFDEVDILTEGVQDAIHGSTYIFERLEWAQNFAKAYASQIDALYVEDGQNCPMLKAGQTLVQVKDA